AGRAFSGGWGCGFGRGGGWRWGGFPAVPVAGYPPYAAQGTPLAPVQEVTLLKAQKAFLEQQQQRVKDGLEALEKRINDLETRKE
ncbi:MAG: DUF5320 family protein, partial [Candidatus Lokiarchaeota archaeon]|nr:DUF5320 family protein [Candidatus Lokiarchaeota archaeon]